MTSLVNKASDAAKTAWMYMRGPNPRGLSFLGLVSEYFPGIDGRTYECQVRLAHIGGPLLTEYNPNQLIDLMKAQGLSDQRAKELVFHTSDMRSRYHSGEDAGLSKLVLEDFNFKNLYQRQRSLQRDWDVMSSSISDLGKVLAKVDFGKVIRKAFNKRKSQKPLDQARGFNLDGLDGYLEPQDFEGQSSQQGFTDQDFKELEDFANYTNPEDVPSEGN
ncbi:hypothetical protein HY837_06610 [archaeon]|nr:hypothetical protein [archaeon]